jgi:autotransporter-associated beta strand protein
LLLALGAITRNVGSTLDVTLPAGAQSATNGVTTTSAASNAILPGYLTINKTDWAAKATNNLVAYTAYTNDSWGATSNTTVTTSSAPAAGSTTNSLRFNAAGANTLTLSGTNVISTGGVLVTPNVGSNLSEITGGTLGGRAGADLTVHQHNASAALTIGSAIVDNAGATGLTKSGAGQLTVTGANTYTGPTTVNDGKLLLQTNLTTSSSVLVTGGKLEVADGAGNNRVIKTASLSTSGSGRIDLRDNKIIVAGGNIGALHGDVYSGLSGLVQSGLNAGTWAGPGVATSMPDAASGLTTIGVASGAQIRGLGATDTDVWGGQTITGASALAMYTYAGDLNLDGLINGDDYANIDFNSGTPGTFGYFNGDINYDGVINGDDYAAIDFGVNAQGAPFATSDGVAGVSLVAVPEPSLLVIGLVPVLMAGRRRRRQA